MLFSGYGENRVAVKFGGRDESMVNVSLRLRFQSDIFMNFESFLVVERGRFVNFRLFEDVEDVDLIQFKVVFTSFLI